MKDAYRMLYDCLCENFKKTHIGPIEKFCVGNYEFLVMDTKTKRGKEITIRTEENGSILWRQLITEKK